MKKFVFSLESLQRTKKMQETETRKALAVIDARLTAETQALDLINRESSLLRETWLARRAGGLNPMEFQQYNNSYSQLNELAKAKQAQIVKIDQEKAQCQERLVRMLTEIKALENLREQQYAAYKHELDLEMAKEIDDFVASHLQQSQSING